jgi:diaminopimelate decarboxylase
MSTPLQFFTYKNGQLSAEGMELAALVESHGTPLYVYSAQGLIQPLQELQAGLSGLDSLICFAMKANPNLSLIQLMTHSGAGLDVVTGGELYRAQKIRVPPEKIVFSGVGKSAEEMRLALLYGERGIYSFNIESVEELKNLNQVASSVKRKANIALRFNPDVNPKTHPYIATGLKDNKFGLNRKEILQVVAHLRDYPWITLKGLSIHIGSQMLSLKPLEDAFIRLKNLIQVIRPQLPEALEFVDLGGGIGITYQNERPPSLTQYCKLIKKHFAKSSAPAEPLAKKIIIEPGRVLSANAGILITRVLYRKQRRNKNFLIVDAGMNDLMRPALYGSYHHIVPLVQVPRRARKNIYDIVGPICESSDCFAKGRTLPGEILPGSLLGILSVGAYGFSMANHYNCRPKSAELLVNHETCQQIGRRETYEDLIRLEEPLRSPYP